MANRYFAGEDPIGKQIYYDWAPNAPMEIVGIVEDIKEGPLQNPNLPVLYVPFDQNPKAWFAVLIRTAPNGESALASVSDAIHQIDRDIAVSGVGSMTDDIQNSSIAYTLPMTAFGPFFAWGASGDFWPAILSSPESLVRAGADMPSSISSERTSPRDLWSCCARLRNPETVGKDSSAPRPLPNPSTS